ncbi:MAG: hypothetical protein IJN39_03200, partial [Clostridia bacterium]|nr:hypothetical protein [Clostridia bacterium]
MNNIYVQALDRCRYAEIYKPLYSAPHNIPLGVVNCGMARVFAGYTSEICNHKGFVLMFCTDGKGEIVVGNTAYPVKKGEFICYRSTQSRVVLNPKSDLWTYRWIEIDGTSARFYYDRFNEQSFPHLTVNVM